MSGGFRARLTLGDTVRVPIVNLWSDGKLLHQGVFEVQGERFPFYMNTEGEVVARVVGPCQTILGCFPGDLGSMSEEIDQVEVL